MYIIIHVHEQIAAGKVGSLPLTQLIRLQSHSAEGYTLQTGQRLALGAHSLHMAA